jgi:hypothetical protein
VSGFSRQGESTSRNGENSDLMDEVTQHWGFPFYSMLPRPGGSVSSVFFRGDPRSRSLSISQRYDTRCGDEPLSL